MGKSCNIYAQAKNSQGELVDSKLFKDLLSYTGERELAKKFYAIGTNKTFLEKVGNKAKFDDLGEITFKSLKELAKIDLGKEKELSVLNKKILAGTYEYSEGVLKMQNFNRVDPYNNKYMALLTPGLNGKYELSIVEKTTANKNKLVELVENKNLTERIIFHLNKAGVDVEFLTEGEKNLEGRYSTKNAKKTADGLYNLIQVINGKQIDKILAEEAGHFAIGALGKSPLVSRLEALLTPEVQDAILGNNYDSKFLGKNPAREVAGVLVGRVLLGHIDNKPTWVKFAEKIVALTKRVFARIMGDDIKAAKISALLIATKIADGFMSPDFTGTVEQALDTEETLYSKQDSFNFSKFKEVAAKMKLQAQLIKSINASRYQEYNTLARLVENVFRENEEYGVLTDLIALQGILEAVLQMANLMLQEIPLLLNSIDFDNVEDFAANMARNANSLRILRVFTNNAVSLVELVENHVSNIPSSTNKFTGNVEEIEYIDESGILRRKSLTKEAQKLKDSISSSSRNLTNILIQKEREFFLKFLEDSLGLKFIRRAARIVYAGRKREPGTPLLIRKEIEEIPISQLLDHLDKDIGWLHKTISSMSNNPDVVGQIVDKVSKQANKMADDMTNRTLELLLLLMKELKDLGYKKTDIFFERSNRTGKLTGNFISKYNMGDYETDYQEYKDTLTDEFTEKYADKKGLSDLEVSSLYEEFMKAKIKEWKQGNLAKGIPAHNKFNIITKKWEPADQYLNPEYETTIKQKGLEPWFNKIKELKDELDKKLPPGATTSYRAPQFKGIYSNRLRNRQAMNSAWTSLKEATWTKIRDAFVENADDTDFGHDGTYNSEKEKLLPNKLAYEVEKIHRLPIYGVNKLENLDDLSTDLFYSLFAYAGMANQFLAMSSIVDTLEVGKTVLEERSIGRVLKERQVPSESNAYLRYTKFLDKLIYGINFNRVKIGKHISASKLAGVLNRTAAVVFLGGNVAGGIVNLGTGSLELFKEAVAGEHFDLKSWTRAHKFYFSDIIENSWDGASGKLYSLSKTSLMIRHWNMQGNNKQEHRSFHTDLWRATRANPFGENLFFPYKSGEHYMQSIPYLAIASDTMIYTKDGDKMSLLDAYKVVNLGNNVKTLALVHNSENFVMLNRINQKLEKLIAENISKDTLKEDEFNYVKKNFGNVTNVEALMDLIGEKIAEEITFYKSPENKKIFIQLGQILNKLAVLEKEEFNLSSSDKAFLEELNISYRSKSDLIVKLNTKGESLIWTVDDESSFMDKSREISNRMHGVYNNLDKTVLHQYIVGNMLVAMKGYALGLIERRFSTNKYSVALGGESEGSINTLSKMVVDVFGNKKAISNLLKAQFLSAFIGSTKIKEDMIKAGYSENQFYNMKRNNIDMLILIGLFVLRLLTASSGSDDDEDDTFTGLAYYFTSRLFREQAAFNLPSHLYEEAQNLANVSPVGPSAAASIFNLSRLFVGSLVVSDKDNATYYYQGKLEGVYEKGQPKYLIKLRKMTPYVKSLYVFKKPHKAAASYEYGRRLKTR